MPDMMDFPDTVEKFIKQYHIYDKKEVYTNGVELIPVFRVEQMLEHYFSYTDAAQRHGKQTEESSSYLVTYCYYQTIWGQSIYTHTAVEQQVMKIEEKISPQIIRKIEIDLHKKTREDVKVIGIIKLY